MYCRCKKTDTAAGDRGAIKRLDSSYLSAHGARIKPIY